MISQNLTILRRIQLILDLGLTALAFHLSCLFRAGIPFEPFYRVIPEALYIRTLVLILLVWLVLLLLSPKAYQYRVKTAGFLVREVGQIVLAGTSILVLLFFIFGHPAQSRLTAVLFAFINFLLLFGSRLALLKALEHFRRKGFNYFRVLVVGSAEQARPVFERALQNPHWGVKPIGFVDWDKPKWLWSYRPIPLVGLYEHLPLILTNGHVDAVLFSDLPASLEKLQQGADLCRIIGLPSYLLTGWLVQASEKRVASAGPAFLGWPVIPLTGPPPLPFGMAIKYAFDRLFALLALTLFSPAILALAALVKTTSPGPVFFRQLRVGQNGRKFWMYKFRTMIEGAHKRKKELLAQNEMSGPVFKMTDDPRTTKLGRFLRKTSLDELPQLFNVLLGEMSLVGPRPPLPEEVFQYRLEHRRRLSVRPGLTCLWQISGRSNVDFENWMKLDLDYIDGWSLWKDLKILFRTLPAVLGANGAK
ncbi:MAG: sugar transferase [candidate division Zixibacteria bacterium]|nr:sugar transferase [candidate division Zixibacteria bacterium]